MEQGRTHIALITGASSGMGLEFARQLVRRALRAMFRGRRVVSPGLMNALLPPLVAALPARLKDSLGMRWIGRRG